MMVRSSKVDRHLRVCAFALFVSIAATPQRVGATQQFEHVPPAQEPSPLPYLSTPQDFHRILRPPPIAGDARDRLDVARVRQEQHVPETRFHMAQEDSDYVYPRFERTFGLRIDRSVTPQLIHLLNRALRDTMTVTRTAKLRFLRARPYQRFQLARMCGRTSPPPPEEGQIRGTSYPSGHSAYGWTTAYILASIEPARRRALYARAREYGESRVVCGVHFPSDVDAGRRIAQALVTRLMRDPVFRADLALVRAEHDHVGEAGHAVPR